MARLVGRVLLFGFCLCLFVVALELIKNGASSLADVLHLREMSRGRASGSIATFGFGWLLACLFLSGSPVAALALCFLAESALTLHSSLAMVMGSRTGASFVVLAIGFLYDTRSKQAKGGTYVGALAFLTTASVYIPAWALGHLLVGSEWLNNLRFAWPAGVISLFDFVLGPVLRSTGALPGWGQSLAGIGLLLAAFKLFDSALPTVDPTGGKLGRMATTIYRPSIAFAFGMIVTAITLSVSVSLTLLVPLTVRGIVRRENLIPFILGANITTFMDTVVASLLLVDEPRAFTLVLCAVVVVVAVSLPIVFFLYRPYERCIDSAARAVTANGLRLALFVLALLVVPILLILWQLPS